MFRALEGVRFTHAWGGPLGVARDWWASVGLDESTGLPWVGQRSRHWEPEPLRWLGVNAGLKAMSAADPEERLTGRPSTVARAFGRLIHG